MTHIVGYVNIKKKAPKDIIPRGLKFIFYSKN